jgi:hypothetical protein
MRYLADAQVLGLKGLWQKLCEGELPARCTKQVRVASQFASFVSSIQIASC